MEKKTRAHPFIESGIILVISQVIVFSLAFQEKHFLESQEITPPEVSLGFPLIYFFVAVAVIGVILFVVPRLALKVLLKVIFFVLLGWGAFVALVFSLPMPAALAVAIMVALWWLFMPRIWLHNLLLVVALASMGTVFGVFLAPWTAILFMLVLSVYDILAVRFGYMMWMLKNLSVSDTLPAFIIPRTISGWNADVRKARILDDESERDFSVLGGGDIGFPLILIVSVFFAHGFTRSLVVGGFSLLGLLVAYWVQRKLFKGKPTPALPPISLLSIMGYLIVFFI
jgi:presenilin-like A22 family membrane protease